VVEINTSFTVTNNQNSPMTQLQNNTTWYAKTKLDYDFTGLIVPLVCGSVKEYESRELIQGLYPNPAKESTYISIDLNGPSQVKVEVYSVIGESIKTQEVVGGEGENKISIDLNGLSSGVYLIKTTAGNKTATRKLVIQ
jgi:hypothetical protein